MQSYQRNIPRMRPAAGGRAGFTLIELLVALLIGSMVMAAMVQMFRSNSTAFKLLDQLRVIEQNARVAMDFMSTDFRGARFPGELQPMYFFDNADSGTEASDIRSNLNAKPGTDIVEIFTSGCPEEIKIEFSETAATTDMPAPSLLGCMDCYYIGMPKSEFDACAEQYTLLMRGSGPTGRCSMQLTEGGWQAGKAHLGYNRGANDEARNAPHDCEDVTAHEINPNEGYGWALIGEDVFYYVNNDDPTNPRLVRYTFGGTAEALANHVEDFQILVGEDSDADGVVDLWHSTITTGANIRAVKLNIMIKTPSEDPKKEAETAPQLENSGIDTATADKYRRRVISRMVRFRNLGNN